MKVMPGKPIACGRTAEIYQWGKGYILKLFYPWFGLENIELEASNSRAVHACGIPSPAVGEIISMEGRHGLVYEQIDGKTMYKEFQHKPWNALHDVKRCAELQAQIHDCSLPVELPSQRGTLEMSIKAAKALTDSLRSKVLDTLETLPDGDRICHGDFWPGNVLMADKGEMVIDWFRARHGNPLADLAWTTILVWSLTQTRFVNRTFLSYGATRSATFKNSLFRIFCRIIYPLYLGHYFKLRPGGEAEYHRWLPVIAAERLADNIPELEEMLITQVERYS